MRAEAAESLSQGAAASALIDDSVVRVNVSRSILVVIHKRQVIYLFADDCRALVANLLEVMRQSFAHWHVRVEPPESHACEDDTRSI